ncbi:hypothetical protein L1987_65236 [Smallanthus sonchifolius]|uniref:Uncharacterized protein n=1 Tax=Smallanthus sonchifolius TaxID=185202 RepID=A0ACB9BTW0_9ASTR|nr:hypothetical protein L1987_65236 [Smallanthus sonchifolius]
MLLLPSVTKKPQETCFREDKQEQKDHFAANCEFNTFNQILHQALPNHKPISKRTSTGKPSGNKVKKDKYTSVIKPSAASKNVVDQVKPKKPKDKPLAATKSVAAQVKPSAATKCAADKPKSSVANSATDQANLSAAKATSVADRAKRSGKPPSRQWKAKIPTSIPQRIIIGSI